MFGYGEEDIAQFGLTFGVGAFMLYMVFIIFQLARESRAGKFGTFVLFLALGFGLVGFAAKGLWPATTWDQAQAVSAMAWLADTVHPAFAHFYRPERYVGGTACVPAVKEGGRAAFEASLREIDRLLAGRRWVIGNRFSVVDAYLLVFYRWGNRNGFAVKDLPHYTALVGRLLARPAVRKVMTEEGITLD